MKRKESMGNPPLHSQKEEEYGTIYRVGVVGDHSRQAVYPSMLLEMQSARLSPQNTCVWI